jgi:hypothetical protein
VILQNIILHRDKRGLSKDWEKLKYLHIIKDDFASGFSKHRSSTGATEINDDFACDSSKHRSSTGTIEICGWELS